jgi:glutathione S-transferase
MLQLYGNPRSRAMRCIWMLEELGEPYQLIEKSTRVDDLQTADYLRLNPNARIPTLVDGDVVIWESMAINTYLAQKYQGPMHFANPKVLGLAAQWSFWVMLEMEHLLLDLLQHRALLLEFVRDPSCAERDELLLQKPLGILNDALAGQAFLTGDCFTVADLNVASIVVWGKMARLDLSAHPDVTRWLERCLARPAYGRVLDLRKKAAEA